MSIHLAAAKDQIAPVVLMPGDPLRAKFMAEKYLEDPILVNTTRNALYYTGSYKGKRITIGASGMGCPSIGIYSFELYKEYNVECIIRVGTCGAYQPSIKLFDLFNASTAYSESSYAEFAFGFNEDHIDCQGRMHDLINKTASTLYIPVTDAPIHSGDAFYRTLEGLPAIVEKYQLPVVEMEAFALFANARVLRKSAACLLTVSDNIITRQVISADEREKSLDKMAVLALTSASEW